MLDEKTWGVADETKKKKDGCATCLVDEKAWGVTDEKKRRLCE